MKGTTVIAMVIYKIYEPTKQVATSETTGQRWGVYLLLHKLSVTAAPHKALANE
jgi:hypothetical protein